MSPVMVAPLVVLAALLALPGGMPAQRGAAAPAPGMAVAPFAARSMHAALDTGAGVVEWLLRAP